MTQPDLFTHVHQSSTVKLPSSRTWTEFLWTAFLYPVLLQVLTVASRSLAISHASHSSARQLVLTYPLGKVDERASTLGHQ